MPCYVMPRQIGFGLVRHGRPPGVGLRVGGDVENQVPAGEKRQFQGSEGVHR
jgi:hypothetical protein